VVPEAFEPVDEDPSADLVDRITFVPFLPDGQCVLIEDEAGPRLPSGEVLPGEDYLIDTVLRVPLETAGFRYQRFHPFGLAGGHLYAWIEGARYTGYRPHATVPLATLAADEAAARLVAAGRPAQAQAVLAGAASCRTLGERAFYADSLRTLQRAYLRARSPQEGSGFGGDALAWRQGRYHITEGIGADGSFLDVGCANGLLMESVAAWCAERGLRIEPYGVDLGADLVALARRRLPRWADRIWAGNAIDWVPPDGLRFDYVHVLVDCVPPARRDDLVRHHLASTLRPRTGRLLVSDYAPDPAGPSLAGSLSAAGFPVTGQSSGGLLPGRPAAPTAWIGPDRPAEPGR